MAGGDLRDVLHAAHAALAQGTDVSLLQAVGLFARAAELGDAEAHARLAGFIAAGLGKPADWDRSIDLLGRAASMGYAPALDQMRLIAGADASSIDALRGRVDLRAFVQPRPCTAERAAPRIRIFKGLFARTECDWIVGRARDRLVQSTVYGNEAAGSFVVDERTNSESAFGPAHMDVALVLLRARLANSIRAPMHHFEPVTVLHYAVGQHFAPHFDYLDPALPGHADDLARRGQRVATALVYLNDDYDGGETAFQTLGWRYRGAPGDALVFDNVDATRTADPKTYHAGLPPTRGEKWLLSQWVRDRGQG